ncbi:MAG: aminotransferase class V-fold PLP-dependent enzyme [Gammaproteobacteria bacterium]|nr:aminotransferase class V-fold PLP-dependent enzyme [Gammaproteobacteria bacterium]
MQVLEQFKRTLEAMTIEQIRQGIIGRFQPYETPFGVQSMVYADYVASGRALMQIEHFLIEQVLPFYANAHTEASETGQFITRLREAARAEIADAMALGSDASVIFCGAGATAGLQRLVALLQISDRVRDGETVTVLVGPYEHHSNMLPWRESGAQVIEIAEQQGGGVDVDDLQQKLATHRNGFTVVALSAASNVTGVICQSAALTRMVKQAGALMVWDYAGGAPYLEMTLGEADAIVYSPHKMLGGVGASGVLAVKHAVCHSQKPTAAGGGTVRFVSPWAHDYIPSLVHREEAGTPNAIGDIRAALAMIVKRSIGLDYIFEQDKALAERGQAHFAGISNLSLLGQSLSVPRLPFFAFQVNDHQDQRVHHQLFTRILSDAYGVQARGGCACAGSYAHRLLGIDRAASDALRARILAGDEMAKPGWVRLNLSYVHDEAEVQMILNALSDAAEKIDEWVKHYEHDPKTARFKAA